MGKRLFIALWLFGFIMLTGCSPDAAEEKGGKVAEKKDRKVAEINGEKITQKDFFKLLRQKHPKYFNRDISWIEKKIFEWKRLHTALTDYLDHEAIFLELNQQNFARTIPAKKKTLHHLDFLADHTMSILDKNVNMLDQYKNKPDTVLYKNGIIKIDHKLELSLNEIKSYFPEKLAYLDQFIHKQLLLKLNIAMEGKRLKYHKNDLFIQWRDIRWQWFLVGSYKKKIKNAFKKEILAQKEEPLKEYYQKHKKQFGMYPKPDKEGQPRKWQQFSYDKVKDYIAEQFAAKEMETWKKQLWKKHNMSLSENYFKPIAEKEYKKRIQQNTTSQ